MQGAPGLEVLEVPVPVGLTEPPVDVCHIVDVHVGNAVQTVCRIDGRERRGLQTHGSFCVLPAGADGRWTFDRTAGALLVRLAPSTFDEAAEAMGLGAGGGDLAPSIHRRDPHIERLGWILQAEHHEGYPAGRLFADSIATALAARLLGLQSRGAGAVRRRAGGLPERRLRDVVDYIEAHLAESLTLAELAAVAGFSVSHFKALFRQAMHRPVHRYVLERRVERARTLLVEGDRSMLQIALETGFAHQSHMARCVRRVLGASPSEIASSRRAGRDEPAVTRPPPTGDGPPRR